jgi:hypothetical protein
VTIEWSYSPHRYKVERTMLRGENINFYSYIQLYPFIAKNSHVHPIFSYTQKNHEFSRVPNFPVFALVTGLQRKFSETMLFFFCLVDILHCRLCLHSQDSSVIVKNYSIGCFTQVIVTVQISLKTISIAKRKYVMT